MTLPFRFREAGLDDNERLIELNKRCALKGRIRVYSDRHPDFFAMPRIQGDRTHIWVAESLDGEIVASVAFIERTVSAGDREVKVLHFGELRTDPRLSRSRLAGRFLEIYSQLLQSGRYHHGRSELFSGNTVARALHRNGAKYFGPNIEMQEQGLVQMYQLLPVWNYRASKSWTYRPARDEDLPALAALLRDSYRAAIGAPHFSADWLASATQQHSSFGIGQVWLAENGKGEISACVGIWDQTAFRRTVAKRISRSLKFFIRLLAGLGLIWRLPPVPHEGEALRYAYLRWPAARDPQALSGLLRTVMRQVRAEGKQQFVAIGFHENDRLRSCLRGIFRIRTQLHLYTHKIKSQPSAQTPTGEIALSPVATTPHSAGTASNYYIDLALI